MEFATYQIILEQNGNGTYFFTDCGHWKHRQIEERAVEVARYIVNSNATVR